MSRKKKDQYYRDLKQQVYDKLTSMQAFGRSKSYDKVYGTTDDKIYSFSTYKTYFKHAKYFVTYVQKNHPEVRNLKDARKYVPEWLQSRVDAGLSAWTVQTEAKALGKLFGIGPDDKDYFAPPQRHRGDIKRSRCDVARDAHFSVEKNKDFVEFCRGTGLRRREVSELQRDSYVSRKALQQRLNRIMQAGETAPPAELLNKKMIEDALSFKDVQDFVYVRNGKGGRSRIAPIIGENADSIVARIKATKADAKVWEYVAPGADIHSYRGEYATNMYKRYARKIEDIPTGVRFNQDGQVLPSDLYICRKDRAGLKLDRRAMLLCSKALGHNRVSVVADNYLRNI